MTSRADRVLTAALLAIVLLLLVETLAMGRVARRVPEPVVLITLGLLVLQVLVGLFPAVARIARAYSTQPVIEAMGADGARDAIEATADPPPGRREILAGVLWVAALPALVMTAGLVPSTFLYALVYFRFRGAMRWLPALTAAVGLSAGLYILVERLLGVMLHRGPLPWP